MTLLRLLIMVCVCTICVSAAAQQSFKQGTITTATGEQLDGYILQDKLSSTAQKLHFKLNRRSDITAYEISTLQSYRIRESENFIVAEVPLVTKEGITTSNDSLVFLQQKNTGTVELWQHNGKSKSLYLKKDEEDFVPLAWRLQAVDDYKMSADQRIYLSDGTMLVKPDFGQKIKLSFDRQYLFLDSLYQLKPQYVLDLRMAVKECKSLQVPPRFELDETDIERLVQRYNRCIALGNHQKMEKPWIQAALFGYARYNDTYTGAYDVLEYGGAVEIRDNRWSPKVSLLLGFGRYQDGESIYEQIAIIDNASSGPVTFVEEANINVITTRLQYHLLPGSNIRPFFFAGFQFFRLDIYRYRLERPNFGPRLIDSRGFAEHLGGGVDFYWLERGVLRAEIAYSGALDASLSAGFLLFK